MPKRIRLRRTRAVELYRERVLPRLAEDVRRELAGRDLACWCAEEPCHATALIEAANSVPGRAS